MKDLYSCAAYDNNRKPHGYLYKKDVLILKYPSWLHYLIKDTRKFYRYEFKRYIKIKHYKITHFVTVKKKCKPLEQYGFLCIGKLHISIGVRLWKVLKRTTN